MKITNKKNLPASLLAAALADSYDNGGSDISVTELIDAPKQRLMRKKHGTSRDVSDMVQAMIGTAFHNLMDENSEFDADVVSEQRIAQVIHGWKVSGGIDRMVATKGGIVLEDFKVTTVAQLKTMVGKEKTMSAIRGIKGNDYMTPAIEDHMAGWSKQLHCYAHLYKAQYGQSPSGLNVIAVLRDWSKTKVTRIPAYPSSPVQLVPIHFLGEVFAENYFMHRLALHQGAEIIYRLISMMPDCNRHDRWEKVTEFALFGDNPKRAELVTGEASQAIAAAKMGKKIETRFGSMIRCDTYCEYAEKCAQLREIRDNRKVHEVKEKAKWVTDDDYREI